MQKKDFTIVQSAPIEMNKMDVLYNVRKYGLFIWESGFRDALVKNTTVWRKLLTHVSQLSVLYALRDTIERHVKSVFDGA